MSDIADRIKFLRGSASQKAFAQQTGISLRALANYEGRLRMPNADAINKICVQTGASSDWLLFGKEPKTYGNETADIGGLSNQGKKQPSENTDIEKRQTADIGSFVPYADYHELECEVRGLYKDKVSLLEEVASLKERNRQLEEQLTQAVNALDANNAGMTKPKAVDKAG